MRISNKDISFKSNMKISNKNIFFKNKSNNKKMKNNIMMNMNMIKNNLYVI